MLNEFLVKRYSVLRTLVYRKLEVFFLDRRTAHSWLVMPAK